MMAVTIVFSEFKLEKVVENFKFLQSLPGLALFNLLYLRTYIVLRRSSPSSSALSTLKRTVRPT